MGKVGFLYPPHPDSNMRIRPESVELLEKEGGWIAQRKYNGSHAVIHINNNEVSIWNRHSEPFTTYQVTPAMIACFLAFDIRGEVVLDGELLHTKAKLKTANEQAQTNTIVLFDVLYINGPLLMQSFAERYEALRKICGNPTALEPKKRDLFVKECDGSQLWLAENFESDFSYRFWEFYEHDKQENDLFPEIEGLVCKKTGPASRLQLGVRPYDVSWMMRVRKKKDKIYLF
jgi:hypothetical protein